MKIVSYLPCHYGKDFLGYALKSVSNVVDECWVLYTPVPSYSYATDLSCPDTRDELLEVALWGAGDKLRWHDPDRPYRHEGEHRDMIFELTDADLIVGVDADEFWEEDSLRKGIDEFLSHDCRVGRVSMIHFWKSFSWVCRDAAMPHRFTRPDLADGECCIQLEFPLLHFGYARRNQDVLYKWAIHGHYGEMRKDCNWFRDKYQNWKPGIMDVHPTCLNNYWDPEPYDKDQLPELLKRHPYYDLDLIG